MKRLEVVSRYTPFLPGAINTELNLDTGLDMDPLDLLAPEYVAERIFEVSRGKKKSGQLIEVDS